MVSRCFYWVFYKKEGIINSLGKPWQSSPSQHLDLRWTSRFHLWSPNSRTWRLQGALIRRWFVLGPDERGKGYVSICIQGGLDGSRSKWHETSNNGFKHGNSVCRIEESHWAERELLLTGLNWSISTLSTIHKHVFFLKLSWTDRAGCVGMRCPAFRGMPCSRTFSITTISFQTVFPHL